MNSNNKFDPNTEEGKKKIGVLAVVIICFISVIASGGIFLIPLVIFGTAGLIIYKAYKSTTKKSNHEFDYDKSYYKRKDVEPGLLESKRLEEEYLKGRDYGSDRVNENNLYYDRKTTQFDKAHAHTNMYPTKEAPKAKIIKEIPLTKEEELAKYQNELRTLKKDYNEYRIGLLEFKEKETELKTKIKELKKDIEN